MEPPAELSLEQRRSANIAKNEAFLKEMFGNTASTAAAGTGAGTGGGTKGGGGAAAQDSKMTLRELVDSHNATMRSSRAAVAGYYIHRDHEINHIYGYLDSNLTNCPSLICSGSSGSGKTAICKSLVDSSPFPHVFVPCYGFANSKQFLKQLMFDILDAVSAFNNSLKPGTRSSSSSSDTLQAFIRSVKAPTKFGELALSLRKLMDTVYRQHEDINEEDEDDDDDEEEDDSGEEMDSEGNGNAKDYDSDSDSENENNGDGGNMKFVMKKPRIPRGQFCLHIVLDRSVAFNLTLSLLFS
jgi:hypothetical protein